MINEFGVCNSFCRMYCIRTHFSALVNPVRKAATKHYKYKHTYIQNYEQQWELKWFVIRLYTYVPESHELTWTIYFPFQCNMFHFSSILWKSLLKMYQTTVNRDRDRDRECSLNSHHRHFFTYFQKQKLVFQKIDKIL